jgi:hypothetical protein
MYLYLPVYPTVIWQHAFKLRLKSYLRHYGRTNPNRLLYMAILLKVADLLIIFSIGKIDEANYGM